MDGTAFMIVVSRRAIKTTPEKQTEPDIGYVTMANGVVCAGSISATGNNMQAMDAATGHDGQHCTVTPDACLSPPNPAARGGLPEHVSAAT